MQAFNGIVALTVDGLSGQKDLEAVKQAAKILHYTLAAFVGPEGDEVIILVRIARNTTAGTPADDTTMTEEEADALCREGWQLASALYQVVLPKAVRQEEVTLRSCFRMPLDPSPYVNLKALALPVSERPICQQQAGGAPKVVTETADDSDVSRETRQLMDFLNSRYEFRYNDMMGYTEYRSKEKRYADWQPVDDRSLKGLTMEVRLGGIDVRDNDVRRYVHSNMIRAYDPIGDYLWARHGKWDGQDHIRRLARTVPTKNPYWQDWFYTWFLGMVRQWRVSSIAKYGNQAVPLLISTQGWNKTTFCEQLLPPELSWGYTGNLQLDDKRQVLQQMAQMLLINLDEFNQISPHTQQGFLKNIITLSSVKIKRPYGRHVEDFPRRASFIATTNQADVLADPSGNRRFLGVELTGPIDVSTTDHGVESSVQCEVGCRAVLPRLFRACRRRAGRRVDQRLGHLQRLEGRGGRQSPAPVVALRLRTHVVEHTQSKETPDKAQYRVLRRAKKARSLNSQEAEFGLEHLEFGHTVASGTGYLDGTGIEIVDLHRAVEIVVKFHRGAVGCHVVRHIDHLLHKGLVDAFDSQCPRGLYHLHHQVADELAGGGILQQKVCTSVEGNGHTIKRHVPDSLLPTGLLVWHRCTGDAGICKIF